MRRRIGIAVAVAVAVAAGTVVLAGPTRDPDGPEARNVILLVGDGMGPTHIEAARIRYHGPAGRLALDQLPHRGVVSTYAVEQNSARPDLVTDSASAATAWASGVKTYDNAIGKDAFGRVVPTLMEQAQEAGMRTGNVSTAEITDATPAAMVAHVSRRGCQGPDFAAGACQEPGHEPDQPVAEQIARTTVADVILGGGLSRFEPDDQQAMEGNGYTVLGDFGDPALPAQTETSQSVATGDELDGVTGPDRRVIGLFNRGNLTVEKHKRENPASPQAREPSLAAMTVKAIDLLADSRQGRRRGFLLQVEGALIDKRSHANDAAQTLEEVRAFDEAVRVAVDFARRDGRTLVVVTADHETGGFGIIGRNGFTNAEATNPPGNTDSGNPANTSAPSRSSAANTKDAARSRGIANGGDGAGTATFGPATFRTPDDPPDVADGTPGASLWTAYGSGNHSGADVPIYAFGPASGQFDGRMDNTDIYRKVKKALRAL